MDGLLCNVESLKVLSSETANLETKCALMRVMPARTLKLPTNHGGARQEVYHFHRVHFESTTLLEHESTLRK